MKSIELLTQLARSEIVVGESIQNLKRYLPSQRVIIITDRNVFHLYQSYFPEGDIIEIGSGESVKDLNTACMIYKRLIELEADRYSFILGIGGGVVCDIAGFVGSTYLRGVKFGFVPSTLLSQVDGSVGGKNGVNLDGYKNMIGTFCQPEFVICDMMFLHTLPKEEILNGLAEIVKHALIGDARLFSYIEENYANILSLDRKAMEEVIYSSLLVKATIVSRDEKERGERRKLNFGHTLAHALERVTNISHGEAVSIGMRMALIISENRDYLDSKISKRIKKLFDRLALPNGFRYDPDQIMDAIKRDKKRQGDFINFVLLKDIGSAVVDKIHLSEIYDIAKAYLS